MKKFEIQYSYNRMFRKSKKIKYVCEVDNLDLAKKFADKLVENENAYVRAFHECGSYSLNHVTEVGPRKKVTIEMTDIENGKYRFI